MIIYIYILLLCFSKITTNEAIQSGIIMPSNDFSHHFFTAPCTQQAATAATTSTKAQQSEGHCSSAPKSRGTRAWPVTMNDGDVIFVNFRNSWGVLVFKVGWLRIRLGSVDGH